MKNLPTTDADRICTTKDNGASASSPASPQRYLTLPLLPTRRELAIIVVALVLAAAWWLDHARLEVRVAHSRSLVEQIEQIVADQATP